MGLDYATDAINIKTYPLSEFDNIVLMYSSQYGLIRAVAKGVKKQKSKLGARMQVLVANKLMLNKGRNLDRITQAQALNTFSKLRQDFDKLTYSMYLAELIATFCCENSDTDTQTTDKTSEKIFEIFYSSLDKIANSKNDDDAGKEGGKKEILFTVLKFQLKLMELSGYGIQLDNCSVCGCKLAEKPMFSIETGGSYCKKCAQEALCGTQLSLIGIPIKIKDFLNEILATEFGSETKYDNLVNSKIVESCFGLMKKYIAKLAPTKQKVLTTLGKIG